ncbi:MAG: Tex family protein [Salinivirgaceae bacterium]|nr:Tex family protein [Salinivirgaceae bacterium]
MQNLISALVSKQCNVKNQQIVSVMELLNNQATIPFIARYRKEATGNLDEVQLEDIVSKIQYYDALEKRKTYILKTIEELEQLTPELQKRINGVTDADLLEDLFLPYKPSRKTRAAKAKSAGLEPLAKRVLAQDKPIPNDEYEKLITENFDSIDAVKQGVVDIIAEIIATTPKVREYLRRYYAENGRLKSKLKQKVTAAGKYENYVHYEEPLSKLKNHRALAVFRGVKEEVLSMGIGIDESQTLVFLRKTFLKGYGTTQDVVSTAIEEAHKRLLHPSLENETLNKIKERADGEAIKLFAGNLRQLLMAPPLGEVRVLAIDPGFRTGCKVVCLDEQGNLLHNETIYPHPPQRDTKKAIKKIQSLTDAYAPGAIAIGNGTASKETESFIRKIKFNKDVNVFMVNEDGASVYSASKTAREEFPDYDVTVRGSVSIGRRLLDPLGELIKIDPKSIGVGQYQHDVDQKLLKEELDKTVFQCVNEVGVNINTASYHLLSYVSGLTPALAKNVVDFRKENGKFISRQQIKEVKRLGPKAFEQAAGFLRISGGKNALDNTAVHPESYAAVKAIAKLKGQKVEALLNQDIGLSTAEFEALLSLGFGEFTINDIIAELKQPGRDPRGEASVFTFNQQINTIEDLKEGMLLPGVITNITDFGAFADIGIKQNGLVHISEIADQYISHPSEVLHINDQVIFKVKDIDIERGRIQLSMKDATNNPQGGASEE